jgi:hypothetical protein
MSSRDDRYHHIAEGVVSEWTEMLKEKGYLHGELAYSDELVDIMEEALLKLVGN